MKTLLLLGSTGSIGTQTLDIVRGDPGSFRVVGLAARRSWEVVLRQVEEFQPRWVAMTDPEAAERLRGALPAGVELYVGADALVELCHAADYELCVHGVVGASGVRPSEAVLQRGKALALANKESLVVAGELLMELSRKTGAEIIPVDSEHCAIFQCLRGEERSRVRRIYLTASGGPLRDATPGELAEVTPEKALAHPNWDMGPRITVGSATLMNKTLEVIEAHHLFGLAPEEVRVLIHRQSVVHSMVEFVDGSIVAQLGPPDMRLPIHYCLHHPDRRPSPFEGFDPVLFSQLTFEEPDPVRFPALELGFRCIREGADSGSALNAADEVAVEAFLGGRIGFQDIARVNRSVLERRPGLADELTDLLEADRLSRLLAEDAIARLGAGASLERA